MCNLSWKITQFYEQRCGGSRRTGFKNSSYCGQCQESWIGSAKVFPSWIALAFNVHQHRNYLPIHCRHTRQAYVNELVTQLTSISLSSKRSQVLVSLSQQVRLTQANCNFRWNGMPLKFCLSLSMFLSFIHNVQEQVCFFLSVHKGHWSKLDIHLMSCEYALDEWQGKKKNLLALSWYYTRTETL